MTVAQTKNAISNMNRLGLRQRSALQEKYGHMVIVDFNVKIVAGRVDFISAIFEEENGQHIHYSGFIGANGGLQEITNRGFVPK